MKFKNLGKTLSKHMGSGLAVGAMIGVVVTCYFVAKEAPKAKEALEELDEDAGAVEKVKTVAKTCKKSIISATATEAMILGSNFAHKKTIATLTAFAATQVTKKEEVEKAAKKLFGDDAPKEIHKDIVETKMHQPEVKENAIYTGHGNILCYEPLCGHFFYASRAFIENELVNLEKSAFRMGEDYITMNEWFDSLRLPMNLLGDNYGWPRDNDTDTIGISFSTGQVDGIPYLLIEYDELPIEMGCCA
jgi:hypothetical protein